KPRVVITSCQLDRDKGHKDMFYALKKVREQGVDFRCIVVGTGPDEQLVKEQCSSMGLDDITTFTGHVSNVQEQLGKGDIYVLPSYCEALGIALEEAMAQGLACIARRSGGVPEIWPTDQGSLLVQAHDDGSNMAEALYSLLTLPGEALLGIKKDFYAHAVQGFHVEEQARKVEEWLFNIY
ncbi:glycosyltransferase family 4 protein, partial [Bilophila wadsworthia]